MADSRPTASPTAPRLGRQPWEMPLALSGVVTDLRGRVLVTDGRDGDLVLPGGTVPDAKDPDALVAPEDTLVQLLGSSGLELEVGRVLAVDVGESYRRVLYPAHLPATSLREVPVWGGRMARFVEVGEAVAGMGAAERLRLLGALHAQQLGRVAHMIGGLPADSPVASSARLYHAYQGGQSAKDAYPMELYVARRMAALGLNPGLISRENRRFLLRAVDHAARELGIYQFLDIGTGMPADVSPHNVAQAAIPSARVVYVDNDETVMRHAEALLASGPEGLTSYVKADLRNPETILRKAARTLDLSKPVGLLLNAVLHFIPDTDHPHGIMRALLGALAPGSCVVFSHMSDAHQPLAMRRAESLLSEMGTPSQIRSLSEIEALLPGLDLGPGLVPANTWKQPDPTLKALPADEVPLYAAFALVVR